MKDALQSIATKNVIFHGHVQKMETAWNKIDILCMPSRKEGLPLAALEAMAHGIPVMAYSAGAMPKLIQNNLNGWLIDLPLEDKTCAKDMKRVLSALSLSKVKSCAEQARKTIHSHFSQQALIPEFLELYDRVISNKTKNTKRHEYVTP